MSYSRKEDADNINDLTTKGICVVSYQFSIFRSKLPN